MKSLLIAASLATLATGCAHTGLALTSAERLELYRAHSGPAVGSFHVDRISGVSRWTPLGDQALAIWSSPNQGHLLELRTRCQGLSFASSITISNSLGLVAVGRDSVQPRAANGSTISQPCRIGSARPIDGRALNDSKRELREMNAVERADDDAGTEGGG